LGVISQSGDLDIKKSYDFRNPLNVDRAVFPTLNFIVQYLSMFYVGINFKSENNKLFQILSFESDFTLIPDFDLSYPLDDFSYFEPFPIANQNHLFLGFNIENVSGDNFQLLSLEFQLLVELQDHYTIDYRFDEENIILLTTTDRFQKNGYQIVTMSFDPSYPSVISTNVIYNTERKFMLQFELDDYTPKSILIIANRIIIIGSGSIVSSFDNPEGFFFIDIYNNNPLDLQIIKSQTLGFRDDIFDRNPNFVRLDAVTTLSFVTIQRDSNVLLTGSWQFNTGDDETGLESRYLIEISFEEILTLSSGASVLPIYVDIDNENSEWTVVNFANPSIDQLIRITNFKEIDENGTVMSFYGVQWYQFVNEFTTLTDNEHLISKWMSSYLLSYVTIFFIASISYFSWINRTCSLKWFVSLKS